MKPFSKIENVREMRKKLGLTQSEFWNAVGVTQSCGSRYESGRDICKAISELIRIVHIEQVQLHKINKNDLTVGNHLRQVNARQYKETLQKIKQTSK